MTTIFFDENMPPMIAHALRELGKNAVTIHDHPEGLRPGMPDAEWMPIVGKKGWAILTKDSRILKNPLETDLFIEHKLLGFFVKDAKKHHLTGWELAKLIINRFDDIENTARSLAPPMAFEIAHNAKRMQPLVLKKSK